MENLGLLVGLLILMLYALVTGSSQDVSVMMDIDTGSTDDVIPVNQIQAVVEDMTVSKDENLMSDVPAGEKLNSSTDIPIVQDVGVASIDVDNPVGNAVPNVPQQILTQTISEAVSSSATTQGTVANSEQVNVATDISIMRDASVSSNEVKPMLNAAHELPSEEIQTISQPTSSDGTAQLPVTNSEQVDVATDIPIAQDARMPSNEVNGPTLNTAPAVSGVATDNISEIDLPDLELMEEEGAMDDAMREMLELQQMEEAELLENQQSAANDASTAREAELLALEQERLEKEKEREAQRKREAQELRASQDWTKQRGRPGGGLKPATTSASTSTSASSSTGSSSNNDVNLGRGGSGVGMGQTATERQRREQQQAQQQHDRTMESNRMSSLLESQRRSVESKLAGAGGAGGAGGGLEAKLMEELAAAQEVNSETSERRRRFRVTRRIAANVERITAVYEDANTNLYDVLGVSRNIGDGELKKVFRSIALTIHPDKNPHPDAKVAFDAIQDAFATLSSPGKRQEYDAYLLKLQRARRWTVRRMKKWTREYFENAISSIQLLQYQLKRGEHPGFWPMIQNYARAQKVRTGHLLEHLVLLPSWRDRIELWHEKLDAHKWRIVLPMLVVTSLV